MSSKSAPVLKRVVAPNVSKKLPQIQDLARQAKNILGYSVLANQVLPIQTLGAVLRELEIEPFSEASVEQYKEQQLGRVKADREAQQAGQKQRRRSFSASSRYRETVAWRRTLLAGYSKAIPEFALRKAVQIKQACPAVELSIDELRITRKRVSRQPRGVFDGDPFLVANLGPETYYVEVWDEAKFENRLL